MKHAHLPVHVATIAALVAIARARRTSSVSTTPGRAVPSQVYRDLHRIGLMRRALARPDIRNASAYVDREFDLVGRLRSTGFLLMVRPEIGL